MDLTSLNQDIGSCQLCLRFSPLIKNPNLKRGGLSKIMVIGLSPGRTETKNGVAFSGSAGKKLFSWLQNTRIWTSENEIRNLVYFTSLIKCEKTKLGEIQSMFENCKNYLQIQIELVKPEIVIPLGVQVFHVLFGKKKESDELLGNCFKLEDIIGTTLFPEMSLLHGVKYIIPLPHPSGRNRTLNDSTNKELLARSLQLINLKYNET